MIFSKATVYGGGLIGSGWAVCFMMHGVDVTIFDVDETRLQAVQANINHILAFLTSEEIAVLTQEQQVECLNRVKYTCDVKEAVENAEFIQENTPEKLPIKQSVIAAIEQYNSTAIIASSTSSMSITDIAANAKHPERIIAGHPFNPVYIVPLVELSKGEKTSQESIDKAYAFYKEVGKEPIVLKKECKGFVANYIQNALYNACHHLVTEGICDVVDVDKAVVFGPGIRWGLIGPYMVLELAGGDGGIYSRMTKYGLDPNIDLDAICRGVEEELSQRQEFEGTDHRGLEQFRDIGLVTYLKYHRMV